MTANGDPRPDLDRRLEGWGGADDVPDLSPEQVARLQEREEPVAAANFGESLSGDLGNAEVAADPAPETVTPDTSLGHEGGRRYEEPGTPDAGEELAAANEGTGEGHGRTEPGRGPTAAGEPS